MKGKVSKFQYLMDDGSYKVLDIDGDEFAECDYGIVLDNSDKTQQFLQKLEGYAQALIQNQAISTSTLLKLWDGSSMSDITRSVEEDERNAKEAASQAQQAQQEQFQAQLEQTQANFELDLQTKDGMNQRDNETKLLIANISAEQAQAAIDNVEDTYDPQRKEELQAKIEEFNKRIALDKEKLNAEKHQASIENHQKDREIAIKAKQANKPTNKPTK
jgi:DNA repair exonuclease SbcCD ATPase subunit